MSKLQVHPASSERLELKFVVHSHDLSELRARLNQHPFGFFTPYPSRRVNNVYFDQHAFQSYARSNEGESFRTKVRYRWYGESDRPDAGQLEVKVRRNHLGWKKSFAVDHFPDTSGEWSDIMNQLKEQLPAEGRWWLLEYDLPVVLNRYRRDYWRSRDQRVRVTLDRDQTVYDQTSSRRINLHRSVDARNLLILEVKGLAEDADLLSDFVADLPMRRSRHSKYCSAVEAIL